MLGQTTRKAYGRFSSQLVRTKLRSSLQAKTSRRNPSAINQQSPSTVVDSTRKPIPASNFALLKSLRSPRYPTTTATTWFSSTTPRVSAPLLGAFSLSEIFSFNKKPETGDDDDDNDDDDDDGDTSRPFNFAHVSGITPENWSQIANPKTQQEAKLNILSELKRGFSLLQNVLRVSAMNAEISDLNAERPYDQQLPPLPPPPQQLKEMIDDFINANENIGDEEEAELREMFGDTIDLVSPPPLVPIRFFRQTIRKLSTSSLSEPGTPIFEYNIDLETSHEKDIECVLTGDRIADIRATQIYCLTNLSVLGKILAQLHNYLETHNISKMFYVPDLAQAYLEEMSTFPTDKCQESAHLNGAKSPINAAFGDLTVTDFMSTTEEMFTKLFTLHTSNVLGVDNSDDEMLVMLQDRYYDNILYHIALIDTLRTNSEIMLNRMFNLHLLHNSFSSPEWRAAHLNPESQRQHLQELQAKYPDRSNPSANSTLFQLCLARCQLFYPLLDAEQILSFRAASILSRELEEYLQTVELETAKRVDHYSEVFKQSELRNDRLPFKLKNPLPLLQVSSPHPLPEIFTPIEDYIGDNVFDISAFESDLLPKYRSFVYSGNFTQLFFTEPLPMCAPTELIPRPYHLKFGDPDFQQFLSLMQLRKRYAKHTPLVRNEALLLPENQLAKPSSNEPLSPVDSLKTPFGRDLVRFSEHRKEKEKAVSAAATSTSPNNPQPARHKNAPKPFENQPSVVDKSANADATETMDGLELKKPLSKTDRLLQIEGVDFLSDEYQERQLDDRKMDKEPREHQELLRTRAFFEKEAQKDLVIQEKILRGDISPYSNSILLDESYYDLPPSARNKAQRELNVMHRFHREKFAQETGFNWDRYNKDVRSYEAQLEKGAREQFSPFSKSKGNQQDFDLKYPDREDPKYYDLPFVHRPRTQSSNNNSDDGDDNSSDRSNRYNHRSSRYDDRYDGRSDERSDHHYNRARPTHQNNDRYDDFHQDDRSSRSFNSNSRHRDFNDDDDHYDDRSDHRDATRRRSGDDYEDDRPKYNHRRDSPRDYDNDDFNDDRDARSNRTRRRNPFLGY